jgi:hypothetical protein
MWDSGGLEFIGLEVGRVVTMNHFAIYYLHPGASGESPPRSLESAHGLNLRENVRLSGLQMSPLIMMRWSN